MIVVALRLADFASNMLIGRPVNLSLDLMLLPAILEVLSGSASWLELAVAFVLVPVALVILFAMNLGAIGIAARFLETPINRRLFAGRWRRWWCSAWPAPSAFAPLDQGAAALLAGQAADASQASSLAGGVSDPVQTGRFRRVAEGCGAGPSGTARCLCHVLRILWRNGADQSRNTVPSSNLPLSGLRRRWRNRGSACAPA